MSGFALAQLCSLARNAIIGYWLSKGDFGIAAIITIALQMLETLSDLGADRLIVQASDGDDPRLMAAAHTTLVLRGLLTGALLYVGAGPIVAFFDIAAARGAFELAALVPVIKGFLHLGARLHQRGLENVRAVVIEVVPQAAALLMVFPVINLAPDYKAVVWLAILQATLSVVTSQLLCRRRYAVGFDHGFVRRLLMFGWPIWLSAIPLVAVYHGDRLIVGRLIGIEALAGYSAAFMVVMVPGLVAAKIGHALMLPLLVEKRSLPSDFHARCALMLEGTSIVAAAYLAMLVLAGGTLLPMVFGPNYAGLGSVIGWLAAMWALRMVQAVPGIAMMAQGNTLPLLLAGVIRALALAPALVAAQVGAGLAAVAAAGVVGELASLVYITARLGRGHQGLTTPAVSRALYPVVAGLTAMTVGYALPATQSPWLALSAAGVVAVAVGLSGLAAMPCIRGLIESRWESKRLRGQEARNAEQRL